MNKEINHWKCSICGRELTRVEPDETGQNRDYDFVLTDTYFDIERSKKILYLSDNDIEEAITERNVKMSRQVCQSCFDKILSESPTLRKTFTLNGELLY